ncbi:hypothetical protein GN244_ATG05647 [Phytophthora infestans]|uniref:Uncharacterized protein n=1 Tax=Phytophthora infestans TaxID=4787 RepID=A0A833WIH1_PHYIN|nr:hypothetical protein GN244_ATG05647 [Phytophthora infestans]
MSDSVTLPPNASLLRPTSAEELVPYGSWLIPKHLEGRLYSPQRQNPFTRERWRPLRLVSKTSVPQRVHKLGLKDAINVLCVVCRKLILCSEEERLRAEGRRANPIPKMKIDAHRRTHEAITPTPTATAKGTRYDAFLAAVEEQKKTKRGSVRFDDNVTMSDGIPIAKDDNVTVSDAMPFQLRSVPLVQSYCPKLPSRRRGREKTKRTRKIYNKCSPFL